MSPQDVNASAVPGGHPISIKTSHRLWLCWGAYTAVVWLGAIILVFQPDFLLQFLDRFTTRNYQGLLNDRPEFLLDLAVIWLAGLVLLFLDSRCRDRTAKGLLQWLGAVRRVPEGRLDRAVRIGTWVASFVVAPVLAVAYIAHLGMSEVPSGWFFGEDGLMEDLQFAGFVFAAVLLAVAAYRAKGGDASHRWRMCFMIVLAMAFMVVAMEEISWGQRLFGIQTPDGLSQINMQHELNFHNIFNTYLASLNLLVGTMVFAVVSLSCWWDIMGYRGRYHAVLDFVRPNGSLIVLCTIILIPSNHLRMNELIEFLAAMVVVLYAIDVCARVSRLRVGR